MPPEPEPSALNLRRLRTYTFFTVIGTGPAVLFMAVLFLAGSDLRGTDLALVGGAVTISVVLCTAALALHWHGQGPVRRKVFWALSLVMMVIGAAAEARSGAIEGVWAAPAGMLAAEFALWFKPGKRARALLWACAAALGSVVVFAQLGWFSAGAVVVSVLMVPTVSTAIVCQLWHYQVARELEQARGLAADLAVAEERLRFAGELHDIQGGNLQAITLKAQVARRLVTVDPERAEAEMRAVEELARAALKDAREVVGGYRKVALADEIDSAARILESAGVQATVPDAAPSLDEDTEKLLGLLVREATTNLIRHAEPTAADVSIVEVDAQVTVTVTNNGAPSPVGRGNGLTMLRDRFTEAGGTVEHAHDGDRFTLKGTVPKAAPPQVPAPRAARPRRAVPVRRIAPKRARR
ncbi:sensor histidine kinase [Glycomyces tritici]|uniref:Histidine kinase n=1 Tax=Glycomyces tritici TaxID=2665176 RepID=A0ABT7YVK7_9ACTN|nr:histidine kinase [Glycomyces tritici]MDN3242640.1 histidine kinase [Glycomyces tritici]